MAYLGSGCAHKKTYKMANGSTLTVVNSKDHWCADCGWTSKSSNRCDRGCDQLKGSSGSKAKTLCICGKSLDVQRAEKIYSGGSVCCDVCRRSCDGKELVFHCPRGKITAHSAGYDLCLKCQKVIRCVHGCHCVYKTFSSETDGFTTIFDLIELKCPVYSGKFCTLYETT